MKQREHWATRFGLILAMAGNAVGLGNFLRFPVKAAANGGGAFMIPYFLALLLLGIPLMWIEWGLGRYGGVRNHGTSPGVFELIWRTRISKYFGLLGVALPLVVVIYYTYIESWTLAYAYFAAKGQFQVIQPDKLPQFFNDLLGGKGYTTIYIFFIITVLLNFLVMRRGISGGIERLAKIAMPMLFIFALILVVRVLTLGSPLPEYPERSVWNGMAFLWNPDFSRLSEFNIWLEAAGQVFFTLSIGFGVISCYASYLRKNDDIALSGLTTASLNEFAEVVLGGSLAIPLAFAFLGGAAIGAITQQGPFALAFITIPMIFQKLPWGQLFATLWYLLLFFAGITSSVALAQSAITFIEDEYDWPREKTVAAIWSFIFICVNLVIFSPSLSVMDEMDFWAGTVGIVVFGLLETILFMWIFGARKAWIEINRGADIKIPGFMFYVMKYVTPVYLLVLLVGWTIQEGPKKLLMSGVVHAEISWRWAARVLMILIMAAFVFLIKRSRILKRDEVK